MAARSQGHGRGDHRVGRAGHRRMRCPASLTRTPVKLAERSPSIIFIRLGYGIASVSPIYDGLLRPDPAEARRHPDLVPALAAGAEPMPTPASGP